MCNVHGIWMAETTLLKKKKKKKKRIYISILEFRGGARNFCLEVKCDVNIFIKTTSTHINIHICTLFYYIYTLFI